MRHILEVLKTTEQTTHTQESAPHSSNSFPLAAIRLGGFDDPIPLCPACGEPMYRDKEFHGEMLRLPDPCRCRRERFAESAREEAEQALREERRKLERFRAYSLMDDRFVESTFANWAHSPDNRKYYDFGMAYCEKWDEMLTNGFGCLFFGAAGTGKTYLSFAIANELDRRNVSVLAISVSRIMKILQDTYQNRDDRHNLGEIYVLNTLDYARLLILDDLGTEYKTAWAYEKLYSIIDARYRSKKPLIITTNLDVREGMCELRENLKIVDSRTGQLDHKERIYNRLVEMCSQIEIKGQSWRISKGIQNKARMLETLGVGG